MAAARDTVRVRLAELDDAVTIRAIYNNEVEHHTTTFDLVPRTLEDQRNWLAARSGAIETCKGGRLMPLAHRPATEP